MRVSFPLRVDLNVKPSMLPHKRDYDSCQTLLSLRAATSDSLVAEFAVPSLRAMAKLTEHMALSRARTASLADVMHLNCWGASLSDVSILTAMPNVEVLSLSVNNIESLRVFASCVHLRELYLRKNRIANINELCYLQSLPKLRVLWLSDNPCAEHPAYRATVLRALPSLEKLDNIGEACIVSYAHMRTLSLSLPLLSICPSSLLRLLPSICLSLISSSSSSFDPTVSLLRCRRDELTSIDAVVTPEELIKSRVVGLEIKRLPDAPQPSPARSKSLSTAVESSTLLAKQPQPPTASSTGIQGNEKQSTVAASAAAAAAAAARPTPRKTGAHLDLASVRDGAGMFTVRVRYGVLLRSAFLTAHVRVVFAGRWRGRDQCAHCRAHSVA
jgi:hypothetical protein